jgi:hypothetical protein
MATFLQLKTRVQQMALESDATEAGLFVNDVYKDIVVAAQTKPVSTVYTLTAGQSSINIGSSINDSVAIMYVLYQASGETLNQILEPANFDEILDLNSTQPTGFLRKFAVLGAGQNTSIQLYPAAQTGGDTLTIWSAGQPTALSTDGSVPSDIPSQWHYLISVGAACRLIQAVGEDESLATAFEQKYEAGMLKFKQWLGRRDGNVTQRMATGYIRNQRPLPHDNSRDVRWSN